MLTRYGQADRERKREKEETKAIQQINKNDFFNLWVGLFVLKSYIFFHCCVHMHGFMHVFFLFLVISLLLSSKIIKYRSVCLFCFSHLLFFSSSSICSFEPFQYLNSIFIILNLLRAVNQKIFVVILNT